MAKRKHRPIFTCDSETDPFKRGRVPKPFLWGLWDCENEIYEEFTDTKELVDYVSGQEIIIYAHNGGKFDWHFLTEHIQDFEPLTVIAGRLAKFKIGLAEFRDSYNLIPAPLSAYQKLEIDYAIFEEGEREKPENMALIREYLRADCVYLGEMVSQFINDYGLNITQASTAMKVWSKMSGNKKPSSSPNYYHEMSPYYYGGRVECFEKGIIDREFKVIDINSAYPYAMVHNHPWGMIYSTFDKLDHLSDDEITRSFISLTADSAGAFPIRTKTGLQFPSDGENREFHITGWEYLAARDTGTLRNPKILEVRTYTDFIEFREYVDHFFDMKDRAKKADDKAQYLFAKIFLNSLYGKFASNPENYQEFMTIPAALLAGAKEMDEWLFCKMLNEETAVVNRPLDEEKHRFYDVAVAASITGFVRAYLWRNICQCEGVIYCDTDSIAAEKIDGVALSDELGDWDIEARCSYGAVAGKKLYAFQKTPGTFNPEKEKEWKTASKGVRLSHSEIVKIAQGETVIDIPEAPTFSLKREVIFTPRKIQMNA